jgi:hypothetical protein
MPFNLSFALFLCLHVGACSLDAETKQERSPEGASTEWEWIYVAGFANPAMSPEAERALNLLSEALRSEGVRWSAAGSRGYSLSIDSRDLLRGREIVHEVVDRYGLPVQIEIP